MTINVVQSATLNIPTTSVASIASNPLSGTVAGNSLLFHAETLYNNSFSGVPTDTQGNTYVLIGTVFPASSSQAIGLWLAANIAGGAGANTATQNLGFASNQRSAGLVEIGGVAASPSDGTNGAINASPGTGADGAVTGTATNTKQPALIYSVAYHLGTLAVGTGFTVDRNDAASANQTGNVLTQYKRITTTSAVQATCQAATGGTNPCPIIMVILDELVQKSLLLQQSSHGGF